MNKMVLITNYVFFSIFSDVKDTVALQQQYCDTLSH